jgi:hypothetical protein
MSSKTYESLEYIAQMFRTDCSKFIEDRYGGKYQIKHSKDKVYFRIGEVDSYISFNYENEKPFITLEMTFMNDEETKKTATIKERMEIKRSKTNRISGSYFPKLIEKFIMPSIKTFYEKYGKL